MPTNFDVIITGEPPKTPKINFEGRELVDGERVQMPAAMALGLADRGLAVLRGNVEIEAILKEQRGAGVMAGGQVRFHGDQAAVSWGEAHNLISRGKARLAEGVTLPLTNPDKPQGYRE